MTTGRTATAMMSDSGNEALPVSAAAKKKTLLTVSKITVELTW